MIRFDAAIADKIRLLRHSPLYSGLTDTLMFEDAFKLLLVSFNDNWIQPLFESAFWIFDVFSDKTIQIFKWNVCSGLKLLFKVCRYTWNRNIAEEVITNVLTILLVGMIHVWNRFFMHFGQL